MAAVRLSRTFEVAWWGHRWLYQLSEGGSVGDRTASRVLLLTTVGRRSGAYDEYQRRTSRILPVIVLEPVR